MATKNLAASMVSGVASATTTLRNQQLLQAAMAVPPELRKFMARRVLHSQVTNKPGKQYYSTVRFGFDVAKGTDPQNPQATAFEYRFARRQVSAFSYGTTEDATAAGFPSSFRPSEAETNLISRYDTAGAVVKITGLSFHLSATSDAALAALVFDNCFADITLDGSTRHALLGRLDRIPQSGGLYGVGASHIVTPPLGASIAQVGVLSNGMPMASNYLRLREPITWNPTSKVDSKFQIRFATVRDLFVRATPRLAGPGIAEFAPPQTAGEPGTFVDVIVYMHTREIAPRSTQA